MITKGEVTGGKMERLKRLVFKIGEEADRRKLLQAHKILISSIKPPLF